MERNLAWVFICCVNAMDLQEIILLNCGSQRQLPSKCMSRKLTAREGMNELKLGWFLSCYSVLNYKVTEKRKVVYLFLTNQNITIHSESFIFHVKIVSLIKKLHMHCDAELHVYNSVKAYHV